MVSGPELIPGVKSDPRAALLRPRLSLGSPMMHRGSEGERARGVLRVAGLPGGNLASPTCRHGDARTGTYVPPRDRFEIQPKHLDMRVHVKTD
ncbi:hypothetical protein AAFF_G00244950 [Aldrovandia affinis]|uniref:Uncharacterized protein n=1 Tax=Aldrovandia affinis TaxID=143900 RepID=A0AAD7RDG2_9TELE|nr:hypothetical protein AAFF_G00244950 [Aldrovandia affinis]